MHAYTEGMSTQQQTPWPDKPVIRIIRGYDATKGLPIRDVLAVAASTPDPDAVARGVDPNPYTKVCGGRVCRGAGDRIDFWEEMAAVPVSLLWELRMAFHGMDQYSPGAGPGGYRVDAVHAVLNYLPQRPSPRHLPPPPPPATSPRHLPPPRRTRARRGPHT